MDFDLAMEIAINEFHKHYPNDSNTKWLSRYITISGARTPEKYWDMKFALTPLIDLEPNQYWDKQSGGRVLYETDEGGKQSIIISRTPDNIFIVFEVKIDPSKPSIEILINEDISLLDQSDFECLT